MKKHFLILFVLIFSACAPQVTVTSEPITTSTPPPAETLIPTATASLTPTPTFIASPTQVEGGPKPQIFTKLDGTIIELYAYQDGVLLPLIKNRKIREAIDSNGNIIHSASVVGPDGKSYYEAPTFASIGDAIVNITRVKGEGLSDAEDSEWAAGNFDDYRAYSDVTMNTIDRSKMSDIWAGDVIMPSGKSVFFYFAMYKDAITHKAYLLILTRGYDKYAHITLVDPGKISVWEAKDEFVRALQQGANN